MNEQSPGANAMEEQLRAANKTMVKEFLAKSYISTSSHMGYPTGNAYQTIVMDDEVVGGYRDDRSRFFDLFDLSGRRVLDCGCNIGELSRLARGRGALYVDGIEFDGFFAHIGRLINAYNNITRVSLSQGDVTKAETFDRFGPTYDVTMAFSVFPYVLPTLAKISSMTRGALILETHNVTVDVKKVYVDPVQKYFPHYSYVGRTDFGKGEGERAVFVFAKDRQLLLPGGIVSSCVNLQKSKFDFLNPVWEFIERNSVRKDRSLDDMRDLVAARGSVADDSKMITGGIIYWLDMMKGYLEFRSAGYLRDDNSYLVAFRNALAQFDFDAALKQKLSSLSELRERVAARFRDIEHMGGSAASIPAIDPVTIIMKPFGQKGRYEVCHAFSNAVVQSDLIDGYHRVFWASFYGKSTLPVLFQFREA